MSAKPYQVAIIPPAPAAHPQQPFTKARVSLHITLPSTEKQKIICMLFSRTHLERVHPGSMLTVNLTHMSTIFIGVLISVRCRGPNTSFILRNAVQCTGVEMQFFVNSPHIKEIIVVSRAGGSAADGEKKWKRLRRAKLFYFHNSSERMTIIL
jgi:large subunit ribosomal protein L19